MFYLKFIENINFDMHQLNCVLLVLNTWHKCTAVKLSFS